MSRESGGTRVSGTELVCAEAQRRGQVWLVEERLCVCMHMCARMCVHVRLRVHTRDTLRGCSEMNAA